MRIEITTEVCVDDVLDRALEDNSPEDILYTLAAVVGLHAKAFRKEHWKTIARDICRLADSISVDG